MNLTGAALLEGAGMDQQAPILVLPLYPEVLSSPVC